MSVQITRPPWSWGGQSFLDGLVVTMTPWEEHPSCSRPSDPAPHSQNRTHSVTTWLTQTREDPVLRKKAGMLGNRIVTLRVHGMKQERKKETVA